MELPYSRRKFITTGGTLLLLMPLAQHCKSKSKSTSDTKEKVSVKHSAKKRKPPINMKMVANRGWYKNKKNGKIHYFDDRGYTPSLEYMKDKKEFDVFVQRLEPWDAKQMTLEIYQKNVSKKKKDWITEHAALAFISSGNYSGAATIIKERIAKRPVNVRLWDLLAMVVIKSGDQQVKATQQELMTKYASTNNKLLASRLARFNDAAWQAKMAATELSWNKQKI